jgi:hypothetical protein
MEIHETNVDHEPATHGDPGASDPFKIDIPVDQNVEVGIAVLLELQYANVLRCTPMLTLQIDAQFCERSVQIANRIAFDFGGIEC